MAKIVNPRSARARERWAGIVEEQRRCGLGVRAFCRRQGVSEHSFYTWRRRLHGARQATPRPGTRSTAAKEPGFLPVRVVSRGRWRSWIPRDAEPFLSSSPKYLPTVSGTYFGSPEHAERFPRRNRWRLYNAFTETFKQESVTLQADSFRALGRALCTKHN